MLAAAGNDNTNDNSIICNYKKKYVSAANLATKVNQKLSKLGKGFERPVYCN